MCNKKTIDSMSEKFVLKLKVSVLCKSPTYLATFATENFATE